MPDSPSKGTPNPVAHRTGPATANWEYNVTEPARPVTTTFGGWSEPMLEILVLFRLGRRIADRARERGYRGAPAVWLLLGLWFAGEVAGLLLGFAGAYALSAPQEPNPLIVYGAGLAGAIAGAVWAFSIVDARRTRRDRLDPVDRT